MFLEHIQNMGVESGSMSVRFPIGLVVSNIFVNGWQPVLSSIPPGHPRFARNIRYSRLRRRLFGNPSHWFVAISRENVPQTCLTCKQTSSPLNRTNVQSSGNGHARTDSPILQRHKICPEMSSNSRPRSPESAHTA